MKMKNTGKLFFGAFIMLGPISMIFSCKTVEFTAHEKNLELIGNPTTGYSWTFEIADENIVDVEENVQYLGKEEMTGAPSLYMYRIKSKKPGKSEIRFTYKRPWESTEYDDTRLYEAEVKASGKISLKKKRG